LLRYVLFDLSLFDKEDDRKNSQGRILWLLEALTRCNQLYLAENKAPLIYQSGIKYKVPAQFEKESVPEIGVINDYLARTGAPSEVLAAAQSLSAMTGGGECFRDIPRVIQNGGGDCDNVSSWRCAELRQLGINARPFITWRRRPDGGMTYHVVVLWPDGSHEDPSLLLGMGGPERDADRREEERKLGERLGEFLAGLGPPKQKTILGGVAQGGLPSDFGKGLQYTIPFQTDDSYESWSPTRPPQYYANPMYQGGLIQNTPFFNTRLRDPDDDDFDPGDRW